MHVRTPSGRFPGNAQTGTQLAIAPDFAPGRRSDALGLHLLSLFLFISLTLLSVRASLSAESGGKKKGDEEEAGLTVF